MSQEQEECPPGWESEIFKNASRRRTTFRGEDSNDVPSHFKQAGAPGRTDFLIWAQMPKMSYSASPESLYDMDKLRTTLATNECHAKPLVDAEVKTPVKYPPTFWAGIALAGVAIIISLRK